MLGNLWWFPPGTLKCFQYFLHQATIIYIIYPCVHSMPFCLYLIKENVSLIKVKMCPLPFFCGKFWCTGEVYWNEMCENWKFAVFPHQEGLLWPLLNTSTVINYYYMYHFACYFFFLFSVEQGFSCQIKIKESYSMAMVLVSSTRVYNARMTA